MVVLKVVGENLEWKVNCEQKGFVWIRHRCFVGSCSVDDIMLEVLHLNNTVFGFIGDRCN